MIALNNPPNNTDNNDGAMIRYTDGTDCDSMVVITARRYLNEWKSGIEYSLFTKKRHLRLIV
ncbi:MAG: hypothetical protein WC346_14440 [Methanogenium sp.]